MEVLVEIGSLSLPSLANSPEFVDKFRLDLVLKGLRSPFLERRLTGLGDINKYVEARQPESQVVVRAAAIGRWGPRRRVPHAERQQGEIRLQ